MGKVISLLLLIVCIFTFEIHAQIVITDCDGSNPVPYTSTDIITIAESECKVLTSATEAIGDIVVNGEFRIPESLAATIVIAGDITVSNTGATMLIDSPLDLSGSISVLNGGDLTIKKDITNTDVADNILVGANSTMQIDTCSIVIAGSFEVQGDAIVTMTSASFELTDGDVTIELGGLLDMNDESTLRVADGHKVNLIGKKNQDILIDSDVTGNEIFGVVDEDGCLGVHFYEPKNTVNYYIDNVIIEAVTTTNNIVCEGGEMEVTVRIVEGKKTGLFNAILYQDGIALNDWDISNELNKNNDYTATFTVTVLYASEIKVVLWHDQSDKPDRAGETVMDVEVTPSVPTNNIILINDITLIPE